MLKKQLLILQNEVSSYNVEMFNLIAKEYDLTVGYYTKDKSAISCDFKKIKFESKKVGPLNFLKGVRKCAEAYDIVTFVPDFHVVNYCLLPFLKHNYKLLTWSIGFRVSYIHPYIVNRKHNILDWIFKKVQNTCDANIYYMEKSKEFWRDTDLDLSKVFVAPNTTAVEEITILPDKKKEFLFVGTLYKGKGLDVLLSTYKEFVGKARKPIPLTIVGDGSERNNLETYVKEHHLEQYVNFTGAIYDEKPLAQQFEKALLCFSPNQAGLSVPKSMGYGVPFVTRKDAITGGEICHITHGENGIMYDKDGDILSIMLNAAENPKKYVEMGMKAKDYYDHHATIHHMAQGAINAYEYALGH